MDTYLKPARFNVEHDETNASNQWLHWFKTFENFLEQVKVTEDKPRLAILLNYIAPNIYEYISEETTYLGAVKVLKDLYVKPKSEIFSRHVLQTRKQGANETFDQYILALRSLAKDCEFKGVTATEYRNEIVGPSNNRPIYRPMRTRTLEGQ